MSTDEFVIIPDKGELGPKEKILIVFSLRQKHLPTYWEGEINCKIKWKTIIEAPIEDRDAVSKSMAAASKVDTLFIRVKKSPLITVG